MAYIGRGVDKISNIEVLDAITFTNSAGPYNVLQGGVAFVPIASNTLVISVDGIIQAPDTYTISAATITFTASMPSTSTMNFMYQIGVGVMTQPSDGSVTSAKIAALSVTTPKIADLNVTAGKLSTTQDLSTKTITLPTTVAGLGTGLTNSQLQNNTITINSTSVPLGGSIANVGEETFPNISSFLPSVITNAQTSIVLTGTNFVSIPHVEAISTTGSITPADSVTFTGVTSVTAVFTLPTDGTYYLRIENPNGLAMRTATASLTVSDDPIWVTGSGSLGTFAGASAISTINLVCTDAVSFAVTTSAVTAGLTFTTGVGTATITGTQTAHTVAATDSFSVTATDAQGQTAVRAFTISWSFGATGGMQFN